MKQAILKVLMENTIMDGRYNGGDEIPILTVLNSEDITEDSKEQFLSYIADEIVQEIKKSEKGA